MARSCVVVMRLEMAGDILVLTASARLGLIAPAISAYTFIDSQPTLEKFTRSSQFCYIQDAYVTNLWMLGARASSVICDGLVFGLTWMVVRPGAATGESTTMLVIMRDTHAIHNSDEQQRFTSGFATASLTHFIVVITTWTALLTSILLSRLMLDLRAAADLLPTGSECSNHFFCRAPPSHSESGSLGSLVFTVRTAACDPPDVLPLSGVISCNAEHYGESESWIATDPGEVGSQEPVKDNGGSASATYSETPAPWPTKMPLPLSAEFSNRHLPISTPNQVTFATDCSVVWSEQEQKIYFVWQQPRRLAFQAAAVKNLKAEYTAYKVSLTGVLCCYDYLLTFPSEIEYVWSKKFSLASGLFYTLRYPAVLNTVFIALGSFPGRSWLTSHRQYSSRFYRVFTAMRVFALFKRNKVLFAFTLGLGLIAPIISIYTFVNSHPILAEITPTYQVCYIEDAYINNLDDGGSKTILVMMRDTAIYFGYVIHALGFRGQRMRSAVDVRLLFVLNVIALGLAVARLTQFILVVSTWTAILTSILLSRLMLDLRASAADDLGTADSIDSRTLRFWDPSTSLSHTFSILSPTGCTTEDTLALDDTQRDSEARSRAGPL
ncbi:uncharacterized protein B0H18DRAFT_956209 [Fomitopsis serialis]|uniref:uncharacterized protein n=1 Tax=Fomitopsis serialis TaxID=139415 RepID=UPI002007B305|nr:uncharacterized protein B0H18DRAFT_956209 [Neoantrodia serialis]KAH9922468.1 hypothetical protein B0H18DRAFT_956209 [Neoantrodia serialis]